jgi:WD40 repeat protein
VYSPSGHQIASGSGDNTVRLWNAQTGVPGLILSGHKSHVTSIAYSPSGHQIASGSLDFTVRLWEMQTGAPGPILSGHTYCVTCVTYSPNGQQIASGSQDRTLRLWDAHTGVPGLILSGHTFHVVSVAYSSSGQQIASGSRDNTVRLWSMKSGQCLVVVRDFNGGINGIAWNATTDGTYFATGSADKSVRMWQVIGEEDNCQVLLHWSSIHGELILSETNIQDVQGLSRVNMQLMKQRGAVEKLFPPSDFHDASQKLIDMASVVS